MRVYLSIMAVFFCLTQTSSAQTIEVQPQNTTATLYAVCVDQFNNIVPNCSVSLSNGFTANTGGHNHNSGTRPTSAYGSLSSSGGYYSGYGGHPFTFTASRVGGWEWIKVCASGGCTTYPVRIRYSNISSYSGHSTNVFIGSTTTHPSNHHGTLWFRNKVSSVTQQYHNEFGCYSTYQLVGVNDMALVFGGLFDLYPDEPQWKPPHHSHDRGKAADFRAKPNQSNSIIYDTDVINRFLEICEENGLSYARREKKGKPGEHVHCAPNSSGT